MTTVTTRTVEHPARIYLAPGVQLHYQAKPVNHLAKDEIDFAAARSEPPPGRTKRFALDTHSGVAHA